MHKNEFAGDVLVISTNDGGDIVFTDGLIQDCRNFDTAAYLSLFGGNKDDLTGQAKETWWGNLIAGTKQDEWMRSDFGAIVAGLPLTSGNIKRARDAAGRDLEWLKKTAGANDIHAEVKAESMQRAELSVEVKKNAATIGSGIYDFQWQEATR